MMTCKRVVCLNVNGVADEVKRREVTESGK